MFCRKRSNLGHTCLSTEPSFKPCLLLGPSYAALGPSLDLSCHRSLQYTGTCLVFHGVSSLV